MMACLLGVIGGSSAWGSGRFVGLVCCEERRSLRRAVLSGVDVISAVVIAEVSASNSDSTVSVADSTEVVTDGMADEMLLDKDGMTDDAVSSNIYGRTM